MVDELHEFAESTGGEAALPLDEPVEVFVGEGVKFPCFVATEGHAVDFEVGEVVGELPLHGFAGVDVFFGIAHRSLIEVVEAGRIDVTFGGNGYAFGFEQSAFSINWFPVALPGKAADGEVAFDDTMARGSGGERVASQCLPDSLCGPAGDIAPQQTVGRDFSPGNQMEGVVDLFLKLCRWPFGMHGRFGKIGKSFAWCK